MIHIYSFHKIGVGIGPDCLRCLLSFSLSHSTTHTVEHWTGLCCPLVWEEGEHVVLWLQSGKRVVEVCCFCCLIASTWVPQGWVFIMLPRQAMRSCVEGGGSHTVHASITMDTKCRQHQSTVSQEVSESHLVCPLWLMRFCLPAAHQFPPFLSAPSQLTLDDDSVLICGVFKMVSVKCLLATKSPDPRNIQFPKRSRTLSHLRGLAPLRSRLKYLWNSEMYVYWISFSDTAWPLLDVCRIIDTFTNPHCFLLGPTIVYVGTVIPAMSVC